MGRKVQPMESEIDELFHDSRSQTIDRDKIRNLEECMNDLPKIYPNLEQVLSKCKEIHSSLELYTVKLESLTSEMREIEAENTRLENGILYQTMIYEKLKELLISIEIKEDHFIALESESFDSIDGLSRIEKALDVLNGFHIDEYDIRIVRERKERINDALRAFYKRFMTHMGKFLIRNESTGELKVHKGLYGVIKRFKMIFQHSKRYRDYYVVLCSIYVAHSKKLYDREFDFHLKNVERLVKDSMNPENINSSITLLFESYRSIIQCEIRFIKNVEIEGDLNEMFRNVDLLIHEFIEDVYEMADVETLDSLWRNMKDVDEKEEEVYYRFLEGIKRIYSGLESRYVDREKSRRYEGLKRLEEILSRSGNDDLNKKLILLNGNKIMRMDDRDELKEIIKKWRMMHWLKERSDIEEVNDMENEIGTRFERNCVDLILGEDTRVIENLKVVLSLVDGESGFRSEVIRRIREGIIDNIDEDDKKEASSLLNKALNM